MPVVRFLRLLPCALLLAALAGAGCGERGEPLGTLAQPYPVTVHGAGDQPTVLEQQAQRIVALDQGSAELIAAVGAGDRLVGVPTGVKIPEAKPAKVVSRTGTIDVDQTIGLKPDLVVATQTADQLDVARIQRATDAAVYIQPAASLLNVEQGAIDLGFLVGEASEARTARRQDPAGRGHHPAEARGRAAGLRLRGHGLLHHRLRPLAPG